MALYPVTFDGFIDKVEVCDKASTSAVCQTPTPQLRETLQENMPSRNITPVASQTIWRDTIVRENEELLRSVHRKLQEVQLQRASSVGVRPATVAASSSRASLASSPSSAHLMLTSASALSMRMGSSSGSLKRSASSLALGGMSDFTYGNLARGTQFWQPERVPLSSFPPVQHIENRWPSIKMSSISAAPLRPELRATARVLQHDNVRWIAGAWRPRPQSNSPRPTPI